MATATSQAQSPSDPLTYHFTNCVGPAGTPSSFDAVKQPSGSASLRLTTGEGTFVAVEATDDSGTTLFATPGFFHNSISTITCDATVSLTQQEEIVTGFIAPQRGR